MKDLEVALTSLEAISQVREVWLFLVAGNVVPPMRQVKLNPATCGNGIKIIASFRHFTINFLPFVGIIA